MFSLKKSAAAFFVATTMFSAPAAFANGGAVSGSESNAGASSVAQNTFGNTFGGASIGGAYCVDTLVIGPLGGSQTMRPCVAAQIAESAGKMGTMSLSEVRAIQLKALENIGYKLVKPKPVAGTATTTSTKAAVKPSTKAATPVPAGFKVPDCETGAMRWLRTADGINAYNSGKTVQFPNGKTANLACAG